MLKTAFKPVLHLEPSSFHHALCTLIIALLAFISLHFFPTPQPSWLLLTSLLLSQAGLSAEADWRAPWQALFYLCSGLLIAAAVFLVSLCAFYFIATVPLLFILALGFGYLGWRKRQHYFAALVLILLVILAAFSPCDLDYALERFSLILLGSALVFLVRLLSFLYQRSRAVFYSRVIFFQKLKQLYQLVFYTSGPRRPTRSPELEESHFQIAWSDCLSALRVLKSRASRAYGRSLDRIWDLTLSLGSLRYRLTDFTVLSMSQDEMQALLKALSTIFDGELNPPGKEQGLATFAALESAIQSFEELYQSMLQTVAKEPLVLLLFIQDLYALKEELEQLALHEQGRGKR